MPIEFFADKRPKEIDVKQVQELFDSVGWPHAQVPDRLMRALDRSEELITAWDGDKLVGLANAMGDGEFYAYIHWLITHADYQRQGIARMLLAKLMARLENRNQVFVFSDVTYETLWSSMNFLILRNDDQQPHSGAGKLIAGFRWHPIPGVHYELDEEDLESAG